MTNPTVHCSECGAPLDESLDPDPGPNDRKHCPSCGATIRKFGVELEEKAEFHDSVRLKLKDAKTRKTQVDQFSGDDLHKKSGKWMQKTRLLDHQKDEYKEVVTNPETGEEVHGCEEPLSKHTGHGTPKKKKR
jgi:predicted nucleic acid-binding Zn ribbon protein